MQLHFYFSIIRSITCHYSNRTLTAKFTPTAAPSPILSISIVDENLDERGGSLGELDYGEVEERVSGGYLVRTYKIYADEYGNAPERIYATPANGSKFIGWYKNGSLFESSSELIDQDIDYLRGSHICAAFQSKSNQNIIEAQVSQYRHGIILRIYSSYPISTAIKITLQSRGSGYCITDNQDGSSTMERYDFEESPLTYNLTVGQSSWEFTSYPGSFSGNNGTGEISEINWAVTFNEFSDKQYQYKKGTTTGIEQW